ncbi:MAG TPA: glycine--tRNA ligase subunit beta [Sphingomonas sp.]|jgi:glycyl-tRNA synthetase beta chain|uniref:glycine--tRNA ligase subunit beta n=1 Tax=Sphingomonas sp. TaxID=28214 RepID=UPI002ED79233
MPDFLLELRSEEIPARMQAKAREDLQRLFVAELAAADIVPGAIVTYATPRRLALIAHDLPAEIPASSEEVKGPRASAPPQALEGFLRKTGLTRDQLTERDGVFYAVTTRPGRATIDLLGAAVLAIVRAFPWPKSMRWGAASTTTESLRWVRPLQGIVALFGDEIVPCQVAGIPAGAATVGHRFHHPGPITLGGAHDYVEKLRACHVVVDPAERAQTIALGATLLANKAGLTLVRDEALLAENAGLTEWPVPLLGRFDADFLSVPPEVIQLTARVNQKYFVCHDADGKLANAFLCTANIDADDDGARIVEGNRKVLAARLSDARFFYDQDLKVPLEEQAKKLDRIVFHEKLGTVADKVDRVAKLARWLVEEGIVPNSSPARGREPAKLVEGAHPSTGTSLGEVGPLHHQPVAGGPPPRAGEELADLAERAARLCKADLVTAMVGEFPELQGLMGGYYAAAQGEHPAVAAAIRDHYKPVGQGDAVPTAPVTVAVSLADKLDSLFGFFGAYQLPSGSKDPFALRRSALGVVSMLSSQSIRLPISKALEIFYRAHAARPPHGGMSASGFYRDRDDLIEGTLSSDDFGAIGFWMERFDGVKNGVETDEYVAHPLWFDTEERWKDFELAFSSEKIKYGELGADETAYFTILDFKWVEQKILDFFADRLKVQQREAGVRHDLIDAVFALGGEDDLVRLLARVRALQGFVGTEDGANLLTGYKRAANILKKEGWIASPSPLRGEGQDRTPASEPAPLPASGGREQNPLSYTPEPEEAALATALDSAEPMATAAIAREDFEAAMTALASLRAPIDAFFDKVTVNDPDPAKRAARLALLARVRAAVHNVADFSRIEG